MSHIVIDTFIHDRVKHRRNEHFFSYDSDLVKELEKQNLIEPLLKPKKQFTECVCLASGPSLTVEDCKIVKNWQEKDKENRLVIAVNETYRRAPFANILYACDSKYWRVNYDRIVKNFDGELATHSVVQGVPKLLFRDYHNSGANAIALAADLGCEKIFLLGYDCSIKNGYHWHGKHGKGFNDCAKIENWPNIFRAVQENVQGRKVVNLSRYTELNVFEKGEVEKWLL